MHWNLITYLTNERRLVRNRVIMGNPSDYEYQFSQTYKSVSYPVHINLLLLSRMDYES